jgi:hypothetical protein
LSCFDSAQTRQAGGVEPKAMKVGGSQRRLRPGGIAQLVEHYAGSVRVRSSSLLASTKERPYLRAFFLSGGTTVAI